MGVTRTCEVNTTSGLPPPGGVRRTIPKTVTHTEARTKMGAACTRPRRTALAKRAEFWLGPRPRPADQQMTLSVRQNASSELPRRQYQACTPKPRRATFSYQSAALRIDVSASSNDGRGHGVISPVSALIIPPEDAPFGLSFWPA